MKTIIIALAVLVSTAATAQTLNCDNVELYQADTDMNYKLIGKKVDRTTISTSSTKITVNSKAGYTEFWKDYNVFRNDDGMIEQTKAGGYAIKTAIPNGHDYTPIKIVYQNCN